MPAVDPRAVQIKSLGVGQECCGGMFGGRGGGKPTFAQGTVADGTDTEQVFDTAYSIVNEDRK